MKRQFAKKTMLAWVLILAFCVHPAGCAETLLQGTGFSLTLPEGWQVVDTATLSQIAQLYPGANLNFSVCAAYSTDGATLSARVMPSQGMTLELMHLFQGEYIRRIQSALGETQMDDVSAEQVSFGANHFFRISFTAMDMPVSVYYFFANASVAILTFAQAEEGEIEGMLSALTAE